jgi:hypothetical protein
MPVWRNAALTALAAALLACSGILSGGDDPDPDPPTDTSPLPSTDPTPPTDTPTEPDPDAGFPVRYAFVTGALGWDNDLKEIVWPTLSGEAVRSTITITLVTEAYFQEAQPGPETYCTIDLVFPEGRATQSPIGDPTLFLAIDHSGDPDDVITNCDDATHPVDDLILGADIVAGLLNDPGKPWSIGVGTLTDATRTLLEQAGATDSVFDVYVGGRAYNSTFYFAPEITEDTYTAFPAALAEDGSVLLDAGALVPIPHGQVDPGAGLATGLYLFESVNVVDLGAPF